MKTNVKFSGSIGSNPVNVDATVRNEIDWERRRFELTKAAMQGLSIMRVWNDEKDLAELTVKVANAVLEEYRKQ